MCAVEAGLVAGRCVALGGVGCPQVGGLGPASRGVVGLSSIRGRCVRLVAERDAPESEPDARVGVRASR